MRRFKIEFIRFIVLLTGFLVATLLGVQLVASVTILSSFMLVCWKPITIFIETFFGEYVGELNEANLREKI